MVHTAATAVLLDELGNRRFRARRLQQLNFYLTNLEEGGFYFLICYFLDAVALATGEELKERHCLFQRSHGNSQMLNVSRFHNF